MPDHAGRPDDSATQAEILAAIGDALGGEAPAVGVSVVGHPHIAIPELSEVDVTRAVAAAISWASEDPDSVRAELWRDSVILTGSVRWDFERQAVCRAVRLVKGIRRVDDRIKVRR